MSRANRKLATIFAIWMIGGPMIVFVAAQFDTVIGIALMFGLLILTATSAYQVRCDNCRWPLIKRWWGYTPIAPANCPKCGEKVV